MADRAVSDEQLGKFSRRLRDLTRRVEDGSVPFLTAMAGVQATSEGRVPAIESDLFAMACRANNARVVARARISALSESIPFKEYYAGYELADGYTAYESIGEGELIAVVLDERIEREGDKLIHSYYNGREYEEIRNLLASQPGISLPGVRRCRQVLTTPAGKEFLEKILDLGGPNLLFPGHVFIQPHIEGDPDRVVHSLFYDTEQMEQSPYWVLVPHETSDGVSHREAVVFFREGPDDVCTLVEAEARMIRAALIRTKGLKANAAQILGISRKWLGLKMKQHRIE